MELESILDRKPETQRTAADAVGQDLNSQRSEIGRLSTWKTVCAEFIPFTKRFLKFGFVGTSGMVVDLGLYGLLLAAMPQSPARALAIAVAMTWNFVWNRQVTFADARHQHWLRQYVGYCASCLLGALVNWWTSLSVGVLHPLLAEHPIVAAMIGVVAGMVFNFAFCLLIVFRPQTAETVTTSTDDLG